MSGTILSSQSQHIQLTTQLLRSSPSPSKKKAGGPSREEGILGMSHFWGPPSVPNQAVNVVLGTPLTGENLKDVGGAEQQFLGVSGCHHLEDGEVFQDAVHHMGLQQLPQLVQKIHQVLAHGRVQHVVHKPPILQQGMFRLHLLHHLLAKGVDLEGTGESHVLQALIQAALSTEATATAGGPTSSPLGPRSGPPRT